MYDKVLNVVDEIVKVSLEFNDDLLNESIASIYSDIIKSDEDLNQIDELLSEVWFLIEEKDFVNDAELVSEIETLITNARSFID